jgi:NAD(P)-dependent dehydrogenase (short-subunit alcohol dehydrogenase family)
MARIFITGSADGLGQLSAKSLIEQGHKVVLHARNTERGRDALKKNPKAESVLIGDLSDIEETKNLALEVNKLGVFDAVIHNAGIYQGSGIDLFTVNTLAPYILTCLIEKPERLIYLSSGLHSGGRPKLESFKTDISRITYSDTKLHVLMLSNAVARKWPGVYANAVNPGWVPTKMGGAGAPDDLDKGYETQVWLATSKDTRAMVSGKYFFHKQGRPFNSFASDEGLQNQLLKECEDLTGIVLSQLSERGTK